MISVMSLAGVRGAVSLAGVLGLPLLLPGGADSPARTWAITLSMGVIALSLVLASVALPLPLPLNGLVLPADDSLSLEEDAARLCAARAAIAAIETLERARPADDREAALYTAAAARLLTVYRPVSTSAAAAPRPWCGCGASKASSANRAWPRCAPSATRCFANCAQGGLGSRTTCKLVRELDLMEAR